MNKTMLSGFISSDLITKKSKNNKEYCSFNLAVDQDFITKSGNRITEYFRVIVWEPLTQELISNATKGYKILVEGRLSSRSYTEPDSQEKKRITEIIAERFIYFTEVNSTIGCTSTPFSNLGSPMEDIPF